MRRRRRRPGERGQSLIEFAFLAPFILVFIAAIIWFGLAMSARSSVVQAVREGARQAAVGAPLSDVQGLAAGNASEWIDPDDVWTCLPEGSAGRVGEQIRVYVNEDDRDGAEGFDFVLVPSNGIFAAFGADELTITMEPRATTRLEKSLPEGSVPSCPT
jgi:hypothetical protein